MAKLERFNIENHCYHVISATRGREPVFLSTPAACILIDTLQFVRHARQILLLAYAILPDHIHLILVPHPHGTISEAVHAIKGYSAKEINKFAGTKGPLWQRSFYDRVIRDERQLADTIAYVEWNPVSEGLVASPEMYPFSSASPVAETDLAAWLADNRG